MPSLKVQSNAKIVRKGLEALKVEPPKIARARMYDALLRAQRRLKQPGKKAIHPVPWVTIKQKRAFYASEGFGGGIPHVRRGLYQKGFRIRKIANGHEFSNASKGARFIGGNARGRGQSPIHVKTHPLIRNVVDKELEKLPNAVVDHLKVVARQKGFTVK